MNRFALLSAVTVALSSITFAQDKPASFIQDFEGSSQLPPGWTAEGSAAIDATSAFQGKNSLIVERTIEKSNQPAQATSPLIPVQSGIYEFAAVAKADLDSPDASFQGVVALELFDSNKKSISKTKFIDVYGQRNWTPTTRRIEIPENATHAQFSILTNKALGQFRVDDLKLTYLSEAPKVDRRIKNLAFSSAQVGNLLYPDDQKFININVVATRELDARQLQATWSLRDSYGAEIAQPVTVELQKNNLTYSAKADLQQVNLEIGKYYELHVSVPQVDTDPFTDFTTFAILPKAPANSFDPMAIPFTNRSWDNRVKEHFTLSERLGIRICGVRTDWKPEPPYKVEAIFLDYCAELKMRPLTRSMNFVVEHRFPGYEKWTDANIRASYEHMIKTMGTDRKYIFSLGNEPPGHGERVDANMIAYKASYETIKKFAPNAFCIGTAIGPEEEYFQKGMQNYCDAYDFHSYESPENVRTAFKRYRELFKKYPGSEKPIWSTEIGLNSHGVARQIVAADLIKKAAIFFAEGGANFSWFGMCYPDPDGRIRGNSEEAHNVFWGQYKNYNPKMDAIAYYNMVNAILDKKFVKEMRYDDISAVLMKNDKSESLQVLWNEKGRRDIYLPLPNVSKVKLIQLDGAIRELSASAGGLSLTISEDPIILLYEQRDAALAPKLDAGKITLKNAPKGIIKGTPASLTFALNGINASDIELQAPAFWTVEKKPGDGVVSFNVTCPPNSSVREASFEARTKDGSALLTHRVPMLGRVTMTILPADQSNEPAVRLLFKNNTNEPQAVNYKLVLDKAQKMEEGDFVATPSSAYFKSPGEGSSTIDAQKEHSVLIPLAGVEPVSLYHVTGSVTDASNRTIVSDRWLGGFAVANKVKSPLNIDGELNEDAWKSAPARKLDIPGAYNRFKKPALSWKGPGDLSAEIKYLWDDSHLYMAVTVTDDKFVNPKEGSSIWSMDGLQFLVDPSRESTEKPGKYDMAVALTKNGPQAWCYLSADGAAPSGEMKIPMAIKRVNDTTTVYEIAFPWPRLAPFTPKVNGNLGMAIGLNEDDGNGRKSFMGYFGNVHSKQVDTVGDIILSE